MYFIHWREYLCKIFERFRKNKNVTAGFGHAIKMTLHLHAAKGWLLRNPEPDGYFSSV